MFKHTRSTQWFMRPPPMESEGPLPSANQAQMTKLRPKIEFLPKSRAFGMNVIHLQFSGLVEHLSVFIATLFRTKPACCLLCAKVCHKIQKGTCLAGLVQIVDRSLSPPPLRGRAFVTQNDPSPSPSYTAGVFVLQRLLTPPFPFTRREC